MYRIKQKLIKVAVGIFILGGLFFVFLMRDNFSKDYIYLKNLTQSSTSSSESSLPFDFNKYLEKNTAKIITTTSNILGYELAVTTKEGSDGVALITKFSISKNNKLLYETEDQKFNPIFQEFSYEDNGQWRSLETAEDFINFALRDITNNGIPEFVFYGYSGGWHCCFTVHIMELTDMLSVLGNFDTGDSEPKLVDINKDNIPEIKVIDKNFGYWNTAYSTSPNPEIIFGFDPKTKKYIVDVGMMRKVAPSQKELESKAKIWSKDGWNEYGGGDCAIWPNMDCTVPWTYAIDLLYSGNLESAKTYIDMAWHDNDQFKSKDIFWDELREQITKSNFYADISHGLIDLTKLP